MIRVQHSTLKMLRAGRSQAIHMPAVTPRCPLALDRTYLLVAPATDEHRKEKLRATVLATEQQGDEWLVTVSATIGVEEPRFLKARPGGDGGDYTTQLCKAARDEPEPVDDVTLRRFEGDARSAEQVRLEWERATALRDVEASIMRLEACGLDADRVALQKLRAARRELLRVGLSAA